MIDLSRLQPSDVGRGVVYSPAVGRAEDGVITSWNDSYVFVRYWGGTTSKATRPEDLEWLSTGDATTAAR